VLAENLVKGRDAVSRERNRSWLLEADGEFIVVTYHKPTGQVYIVTDALGRLPLYYSRDEQSIMISRHMELVVAVQERKEFNRLAIAQYLMFGYSLGSTTLVQDVYGLEPGSAITIDPRSSLIEIQGVSTFCFSEKLHDGKSVEANATELVRLLSLACLNRTASKRCNIVSLSGGLDSRTIAACIRNTGVPLSATTMLDTEGAFKADAHIAEQIAEALGFDWKLYKLQVARGKDSYRLLRMKAGLNYLAMNWIVQYLDALQGTYGSEMTYITGDGGDKVLVDLRPTRSLGSLSDLVQYIVSRHQGNSLQDVARMTGVSEGDIVRGVSERVDSYPEADFANKLVHFVIFERGRRWLFEGEDRNRNFFWHLAPFYGIQFFRYAMNCPDEQKANHRLYRELLVRISPQVANIQNEHWGFPITSKRYYWTVFAQYLRELTPRPLKRFLKGQLSQNGNPREIYKECMTKQFTGCDVIKEYLLYSEVMKRLDRCTKREAQTLLTVTSTLELLATGRSTIKEYWEDEI
jgi:asparagine synthase (glutamine-hydrolysing)